MRHPFLKTLAGVSAPAATDPNFKNVTLLLHGDGTNGAQNNTFLDSGPNNLTVARGGSVTQGTFSPYGDNWSVAVNGSSAYLTTANNANLAIGNSDFTFECWVNGNSFSTDWSTFFGRWQGSGNYGYFFAYDTDGGLTFIYSTNGIGAGNVGRVYGGTLTVGRWHHVAVCRSAGTTRGFIDGVQVGSSSSDNVAIYNNTGPQTIGGIIDGTTIFHPLNGYVSNLRLVIGTALYTTSFTPSTVPLTAVTNTRILACASNRFVDKSATGLTITPSGAPSVQRFSPFSPTAAYAAGTIAGGGYFPGVGGARLSVNSSTVDLGANVFTLESWVYYLGGAWRGWYGIAPGVTYYVHNGTLSVWSPAGGNVINAGGVTVSAWTHIAVTRDSSNVLRAFVNGVLSGSATISGSYSLTNPQLGERYGNGEPFYGLISGFRLLIGTALYTSTFTPPTAPPTAITDTRWLVNFTNAGIIDNAMMALPETVGNAQISTSVKKYGTGSLAFDGTGDWLLIPNIAALTLAGDFTIEAWVYVTAGGTNRGIVTLGNRNTTTGISLFWQSSGAFKVFVNSGEILGTATTVGLNTWAHVAVTRNGTAAGNIKIYLNGVFQQQYGPATNTAFAGIAANGVCVGASYNGSFIEPHQGYIDDLRITNGVARYTANFTPPTAALPDL